jgi:DNA (cytosine-5)-methyltransferase 1
MTHGSLFSGIGGFDLAAEWMGWGNVFHCEYDPFCQKVLSHHFPNSKLYKDVRTFDATAYAGRIDILTGGFPCQPFSAAGKRKGTEDERHLWPEMLRVIREVSPRYIVGENVRGLLNWSGGLVFDEVCSDLEDAGYEVTPYLLPACGKDAPHRRDRIWFIANSTKCNDRRNTGSVPSSEEKERICERNEIPKPIESSEVFGNAPDSCCKRPQRGEKGQRSKGRKQPNDEQLEGCNEFPRTDFEMFPTQPPICGGNDGLPKELDGLTFSKWRNESIKAYGNAIVPQVAHEIFKAIQKMEE